MHEMSLAQNLLDIVRQEMQKNNVQQLLAVKVRAGRLNAVVPDILKAAFEALIAETAYPEAKLIIEKIPLELKCAHCSHHFDHDENDPFSPFFPCPACGQECGHSLIAGQDLTIEYIDAE